MIRAVIFDCFGVLISDALSVMCDDLEQKDPEAIKEVWELIRQANRNELTADESSTRIAGIFGLSYEDYRAQLQQNENKNHALLRYIAALRPRYKTAILSNIPKGSLYRRFTQDELAGYFDEIVASGEIGYAKPEPEAYRIAAERLGLSAEECIFVDDRLMYCEGAEATGMKAVEYRSFAQFKTDFEKLLADS